MTDTGTPIPRTRTLIAADLLLVLFQPSSGTIAGENTLFYVLAGGLLTDLARCGGADVEDAGLRGTRVRAVGDPPADELLRDMWDYLGDKPREIQGVLAAIGPHLRAKLLDRLIARNDLRTEQRRVWGVFPSTALLDGTTGRRDELIAAMRSVLVDQTPPTEEIAALTALVSASGSLPVMHREIPWSGTTATRAKALEVRDPAAGAAASAVIRTMIAVVSNALIASAVVTHR